LAASSGLAEGGGGVTTGSAQPPFILKRLLLEDLLDLPFWDLDGILYLM
jgi:hypothetical protein